MRFRAHQAQLESISISARTSRGAAADNQLGM